MKKYAVVLTLVLCVCLCACGGTHSPETSGDASRNDTGDSTPSGGDPVHYETDYDLLIEGCDPIHYETDYDSLTDLKNSISQKNEEKLIKEIERDGATDEVVGKVKTFVQKLRAHSLPVPYLDGKPMEFRNEEGFSNITLFPSEAYQMPWIWFFPKVSTGGNFYIKMTCLPDQLEKRNNLTASEALKELSPNSANINHLGEQHKSIQNRQITLRNREVTALVFEYKTDKRSSVVFVYGDLLVEVRCDPNVWDAQWFSTLSFESFK